MVEALLPLHRLEVLELGCGSGWYLNPLLNHQPALYLGCDRHPRIDPPKDPATRVVLRCQDVRNLELEKTFDRVLCAGLLEFLEAPEDFLTRLHAFLKPGGRLVLVFPERAPAASLYQWFHARQGYSVVPFHGEWVAEVLRSSGFSRVSKRLLYGFSTVLVAERR